VFEEGKETLPASYSFVKFKNGFFFFWCKVVVIEVRPQIICPSEPTALAASVKSFKKII
jgi:hypothetical protein